MQAQEEAATLDETEFWSDEQVLRAVIMTAMPETQDEAHAHTVETVEDEPYLTLDREGR